MLVRGLDVDFAHAQHVAPLAVEKLFSEPAIVEEFDVEPGDEAVIDVGFAERDVGRNVRAHGSGSPGLVRAGLPWRGEESRA